MGAFSTSIGSMTISAGGAKAAGLFEVPRTGTIDRIAFRVGGVTSSQTLRISLQTLDALGNPSGTLYGGSAVVTQAAPAANNWYVVTLPTGAAAVAGDTIAVVIEFDSTTGNLFFPYVAIPALTGSPRLHNGTSWAKIATGANPFLIGYSDGVYSDIGSVPPVTPSFSYASNNTPDEYALRFSVPVSCRLCGAWIFLAPLAVASNIDLVLYNAAGSVVFTRSVDPDNLAATGATRGRFWLPPTILNANELYRLAAKPTTTSGTSIHAWSFPNAPSLGSMPLGMNGYRSHRTDAGAWTDTTTDKPMISPIFDQFDSGGAGSSVIVIED